MHEMGIACEAYRICRETMRHNGGGVLESVRMVVGELSAVEPALLETAWEAVTAEGPDAGCRLSVELRPVTQRCTSCGPVVERAAGSWLRLCPRCGMPLRVEGGRELDVRDIVMRCNDV